MEETNKKQVIELACKAGKMVLENGGEIYRVEQTMTAVCSAYGVSLSESFATPTIIMLSAPIANGESYSRMMRITERGINLNKVSAINDFSRKLPASVDDAFNALRAIDESTPYPIWVRVLASSIGVGAFTVMFGGEVGDYPISHLG